MTPQEIQEKHFHDTFRGYSHEEVDLFLDEVAVAFERLYRENQSFMRRVVDLEEQVKRAQETAGGAPAPARSQEVFEEDPGVTESTLKRMLLIAQETADRAVQEARQRAREIQEQARARADEMMEHAERRVRELSSQRMEKEKELERAKEALRRFDQQYRASFRVFIESQLEALKDLPATPPVSDMEVDQEPLSAGLQSSSEVSPSFGSLASGPVGMETVAMPVQPPEKEQQPVLPSDFDLSETLEPVMDTQEPAASDSGPLETASGEWVGEAASQEPEPEDDPELVRPRSNLPPEVGPIRAASGDENEVVSRNSMQEAPRGQRREGARSADGNDAEEDRLIRELFWGEDD